MIINLDNYEQFLLMYVDNELSAAERIAVQEFLEDYPYLKEELEILQQTVLPVENIAFDKSSLLKPMLDEATQEKLLMHLDGELPAGESLALQNSLNADALLKKEWNLLQKTKLDAADTIEHPDKESLYRRERARVVTGRFIRWAVAAMFIGAGFYAGVSLLNKKDTKDPDFATTTPATKNNNAVVNPDTTTDNVINNNTAAVEASDKKEPTQPTDVATDPVKKEDAPVSNNMVAVSTQKSNNKNVLTAPKQKVTSTVPQNDVAVTNPTQDNKISPAQPKELPQKNTDNVLRNNNDFAAIEKQKNDNSIDLPTNINTASRPVIDRDLSNKNNSYASTAALGFTETNNQDQILMMEEENVSRSKAGVFFKKLKRNVERRTNIKPGKSLRIAGFEFAVK